LGKKESKNKVQECLCGLEHRKDELRGYATNEPMQAQYFGEQQF
jgi:hypothetical protein